MRFIADISKLIVCVLLFILPGRALAAAPAFVPVQGVLANANGDVLEGEVNVSFTLYDGDVEGAVLFSETQMVTVIDGAFSAYLGDVAPLDLAVFRDHETVYLGIRIADDPEELKPRLHIGAVPYAAYAEYAGDAQTLGGKLPSDFASATHTHPEVNYTAGAGLSLSGANQFSVDTSIIQQRVVGACPSGQAMRSVGQDGAVTCETNLQQRVTGTCPSGQAMRSVGQNGAVTCETNLQQRVTGTCPSGQTLSGINANGTVTCQSATNWPAGSYCILRGSNVACPAGFSAGQVHFDTEDNDNENSASGNIGAMSVTNNVDMYLCCK